MQTTHSTLAFFAVLVGFLLLLSRVPFLLVFGLIFIVGGMFAPFYEDQLRKVIHRKQPETIGQMPNMSVAARSDLDKTLATLAAAIAADLRARREGIEKGIESNGEGDKSIKGQPTKNEITGRIETSSEEQQRESQP